MLQNNCCLLLFRYYVTQDQTEPFQSMRIVYLIEFARTFMSLLTQRLSIEQLLTLTRGENLRSGGRSLATVESNHLNNYSFEYSLLS